jgi:hypothetical protein
MDDPFPANRMSAARHPLAFANAHALAAVKPSPLRHLLDDPKQMLVRISLGVPEDEPVPRMPKVAGNEASCEIVREPDNAFL